MKLLPYDKFELVVSEPLSQVRDRLISNVGPKAFWGVFSKNKECIFNGTVDDQGFSIYKNIHYRNSFLPIISGTFIPHPLGTQIVVRMKLHPIVMAFVIVFLCLAISYVLPFTEVALLAELGMLITMVGFIVFITYIGFWFEAKSSKTALLGIFEHVIANKSQERTD